jgi:hypothetical protein
MDSAVVVRGTESAADGANWFFPGPRIPGSQIAIGNEQGNASFGLDPHLYVLDTEEGAISKTEHSGINAQPLTEDILIYQLDDDAGKIVARRIDAASGEFRSPPVDFMEEAFFSRFQTEPHSGSFVFAADNLPDQQLVSVLNLDSGKLSSYDIAAATGDVQSLIISRDGRELIGNSTSGETGLNRIVSVDLDTEQTVTRAEGVSYFGVKRLGGGRMLTMNYSLENGRILPERQLVVQNLATRQSADTLTAAFNRLQWGGETGSGYLVGIDGEIGLLDANGEDFAAFASGFDPSVSPDERYVAFVNPNDVMAVFDRQSRQISELTAFRGMQPQWASDGRFLYFYSFEDVPSGVTDEADVVRLPVRLTDGFEVMGPSEFVLHVMHPVILATGGDRVALFSNGSVSLSRPPHSSARVGWWRNVGREFDELLPK